MESKLLFNISEHNFFLLMGLVNLANEYKIKTITEMEKHIYDMLKAANKKTTKISVMIKG